MEKYIRISARDFVPKYTSGATNQLPWKWCTVNADTAKTSSNTTALSYDSANGIFGLPDVEASYILPKSGNNLNVWVYIKSFSNVGMTIGLNDNYNTLTGSGVSSTFKWINFGKLSFSSGDKLNIKAITGGGATVIKTIYFSDLNTIPDFIPLGNEPFDSNLIKLSLIQYGGKNFTFNESWQEVGEIPSDETLIENFFILNGMATISKTAIDLLPSEFSVITYINENESSKYLNLKANPKNQIVYANDDISLVGVESIDSIVLSSTGQVKVGISNDGGLNYYKFNSGSWIKIVQESDGMSAEELNLLSSESIQSLLLSSKRLRFSYYLDETSTVDKIEMTVTLQGYEKIADSSTYDVSYNTTNKTITYSIKKDGTYSVNYVT